MPVLDQETVAYFEQQFDELIAKQISHGRQLVESGNMTPDGMFDSMCVIRYREQQRERVARSGYCAAHCECQQVTAPNGEVVCPHTFQPCDRLRLSAIVELWSKIGR